MKDQSITLGLEALFLTKECQHKILNFFVFGVKSSFLPSSPTLKKSKVAQRCQNCDSEILVSKFLAQMLISCVTLGKSVYGALHPLIHKAKTMPYRQVMRLLVTANSHNYGRQRVIRETEKATSCRILIPWSSI